jgi:hypothetical protein
MAVNLKPYREPLSSVVLRTFTIAIAIGGVTALLSGRWLRWPMVTALALWPSFGGHWVEVLFLNGLRPRISPLRGIQAVARLLFWFIAGMGFVVAMRATALLMTGATHAIPLPLELGGLAFVALELVVHLVLAAQRQPNFYNGLG